MPRPAHFEIHADEPERALAFYQSAFNWQFNRFGDSDPAYWVVVTGDDAEPGINGGLMKRMGPAPEEGAAVNSYVCTMDVDDLNTYTEKVKAAGGRQVVDRMPVPGVGWLAYFKDTEGNIFGLMQPDNQAK